MCDHGAVSRALIAPLRSGIRRRIGLWPAYEWRNRLTLGPRSAGTALFERAEVRRATRRRPRPPFATVATIIPTYRRPGLLQSAVASALAQDFADQVVLVVDDGGGDLPVLPEDPRLHVVTLTRNSGRCAVARNIGIRLTSSRYVAFLDDDNEWFPEHLSLAVEALESGADLTYSKVERRWPNGELLDYVGRPFDREALKESTYVDANAIVIRRQERLFFSRLRRTRLTLPKEDWEFVYRMTRRLTVHYIDQPTVRYLINDASYYTPPFGSKPVRGIRGYLSERKIGAARRDYAGR
jgi:glycosyltransferase involved in cell wall biosynthesis